MAGMFYSSKEAAEKLDKTEEELAELVKEGKLREFRDGPNLLFKIDEIDALTSDTSITAAPQSPAEAEELDIEEEPTTMAEEPAMEEEGTPPMMEIPDEESAEEAGEEIKLTGADTTAVASEGINILGETDTEYNLTDDTLAETRAASGATSFIDSALDKTGADEASLEEIEDDVNLDTFGSGSGLLDLSLQADDTSLGGILDEIYTPEGDEEAKEGSAMDVAADAEQMIMEEEGAAEEEAELIPIATTAVYAEPAADMASNIFGIMLFVPLLVVIYTLIVALAGANNMVPSIMTGLQGVIWYVLVTAGIVSVIMAGAASVIGSGSGTKTAKKPKKPKVKKPKKVKEKKPKKVKEKKPKKEKKK